MGAEAVIFFNQKLAETFEYRRKRSGHLFSKMRFLSAQLEAYITDDLWLRNATHANLMAAKLAEGITGIPGVNFCYPVEANELFLELPMLVIEALLNQGFQFYQVEKSGQKMIRIVTAFNTLEADIIAFIETVKINIKSTQIL